MQQENYSEAEAAYRRALSIAPDNNKKCNLGISLMKQGRVAEAKETLRQVRPAVADGPRGADSHLKAFERAQEMLRDLESEMMKGGQDQLQQTRLFNTFLGSSSIWQPQPCKDPIVPSDAYSSKLQDEFADENLDINRISSGVTVDNRIPPLQKNLKYVNEPRNSLNGNAPPFVSKSVADPTAIQFLDPLGHLKRTRSVGNNTGQITENNEMENSAQPPGGGREPSDQKSARRSLFLEEEVDNKKFLPDSNALDEAIMATILGPDQETMTTKTANKAGSCQIIINKKRLKVFQDITLCLSPQSLT